MDEIRAHFEQTSSSSADEGTLTLTPAHFDSAGEVRSETGTSVETSVARASARAVTGAYVVVYTRQGDGQWRIAIDLRTNGRQPPLVRW
jgi:ketosteroid isomerase-like protein